MVRMQDDRTFYSNEDHGPAALESCTPLAQKFWSCGSSHDAFTFEMGVFFSLQRAAFHTDGYGRVRHGGEGMHSLHMTQSAFQALKWDQWLRRTDVQCVTA
ncbi:hypothetical protein KC19_12G155700 [Ceratodon purpureus]|uniref:Uncharacterized protein n=1 Tax=Ceratodon purpureus TaxID=3225 RepID=A0A8T0GBN4_CERPU|nr:hypothetical protein KC19_12G155700 [Ceratodon purpureus]